MEIFSYLLDHILWKQFITHLLPTTQPTSSPWLIGILNLVGLERLLKTVDFFKKEKWGISFEHQCPNHIYVFVCVFFKYFNQSYLKQVSFIIGKIKIIGVILFMVNKMTNSPNSLLRSDQVPDWECQVHECLFSLSPSSHGQLKLLVLFPMTRTCIQWELDWSQHINFL